MYVAYALVLCLVTASRLYAHFASPQPVPVQRIIDSATNAVAATPTDAHAYYVLGRAHYLAWFLKSSQVPAFETRPADPKYRVAPDWQVNFYTVFQRRSEARKRTLEKWGIKTDPPLVRDRQRFNADVDAEAAAMQKSNWVPSPIPQKELDDHAIAATVALRKAVDLDSRYALAIVCLASLQEQFATRAGELNLPIDALPPRDRQNRDPAAVALEWQNEALMNFGRAYRYSIAEDRRVEGRPPEGIESLVSVGAIEGYLRLAGVSSASLSTTLPASYPAGLTVTRQLIPEMKADLVRLQALKQHAITPIVFDFQDGGVLADRLRPLEVEFDMNGDGASDRLRQWTRPTTGFLVWDPLQTQTITSGQQLFGSVTWWLFWSDGYEALRCLDDNTDGAIAGMELYGLAVWFDHNGNGRSDSGEVITVESLGITSIACRADHIDRSSGSPSAAVEHGITFADGTMVPTFDWRVTIETDGRP